MKSVANPKKEEAKIEEEMPKDDGKNETGGDGEQKKEGEQGSKGAWLIVLIFKDTEGQKPTDSDKRRSQEPGCQS